MDCRLRGNDDIQKRLHWTCISNTVHPTLKMAFYPERYSQGDSKDVLAKALEKTADLMQQLDQDLEGQSYLNGEQPYAADYYLTTMLNWLQVFKISLSDYPNLKAYKQRMDQLPEVAKAVGKEAKEF